MKRKSFIQIGTLVIVFAISLISCGKEGHKSESALLTNNCGNSYLVTTGHNYEADHTVFIVFKKTGKLILHTVFPTGVVDQFEVEFEDCVRNLTLNTTPEEAIAIFSAYDYNWGTSYVPNDKVQFVIPLKGWRE